MADSSNFPITSFIPSFTVVNDASSQGFNEYREIFLAQHSVVSLKVSACYEEAIEKFKVLDEDILPLLPVGYKWVKATNSTNYILKTNLAEDHDLEVIVYGPDGEKINYVFLVDGKTTQSFANTKSKKESKAIDRNYPMSISDYTVQDFSYKSLNNLASKSISKSHLRGHCIDHADTMFVGAKCYYSTYDPRNYIPETPYKYWGLHMRRLLVNNLRKSSQAYMQFVNYPESSYITKNGTPVPDYVYFYPVSFKCEKHSVFSAYNIDWSANYKLQNKDKLDVLSFSSRYKTSNPPLVLIWDSSASDKYCRKSLNIARTKINKIKYSHTTTSNQGRDLCLANRALAEVEFESSWGRFSTAIYSSLQEKGASEVKTQLLHGLVTKQSFLDNDQKDKYIYKAQVKKVRSLFKKEASGFSDPDSSMLDHFNSLYPN